MRSQHAKESGRLGSSLTGRFNFKRTLTGRLILRIEEDVPSLWPWSRGERRQRWRDAGSMDLAAPELRALMDLRARSQQPPPSYPVEPAVAPTGPDAMPLPRSPIPAKPGDGAWSLHRSPQ